MAFIGNIDTSNVQPGSDFETIPAGQYTAVITASEMKPTKAGTGEYLQLTMQIIDGQYENRKLFDRLNLINPNETAVSIAMRALSSIKHATQKLDAQDSAEFHDIPLSVKVEVETERDPVTKVVTRTSNVIKGYSAVSGSSAPRAPMANVVAASVASSAKPTAPWAKK